MSTIEKKADLAPFFGHPRKNRLLVPEDFQRVFDKVDCKVSNSYMLLLCRLNNKETARLGFIISKKNIKLAKDRNKIKRLSREVFRINQHSIPKLDVIILIKKRIGKVDSKIFTKELEILFKRLDKKVAQL